MFAESCGVFRPLRGGSGQTRSEGPAAPVRGVVEPES